MSDLSGPTERTMLFQTAENCNPFEKWSFREFANADRL